MKKKRSCRRKREALALALPLLVIVKQVYNDPRYSDNLLLAIELPGPTDLFYCSAAQRSARRRGRWERLAKEGLALDQSEAGHKPGVRLN